MLPPGLVTAEERYGKGLSFRLGFPVMDTKSSTEIPFIKVQPLADILGSRLPLKMDIFRFFFYLHQVLGLTLKDAGDQAVAKAKGFWEKAGIKTKSDRCAYNDVMGMWKSFRVLL